MQKPFRFLKWSGKKAIVLFVLTIGLALVTVGTTLSIIIMQTNPIENIFTPPNLDISIEGNTIENTGDVSIYVRAAVIANWVANDGSILSVQPIEGTDYTAVFNNTEWFKASDGFYYLSAPLSSGEIATKIVSSASTVTSMEGYTLKIQVIASAIQSTPAEAIEDSWTAVTVDEDGKLTLK